MSCYFRHMKDIFDEAGVTVSQGNKKRLDEAVHQVVGVRYKDCPSTWKALKQTVLTDQQKRQELIEKLQEAAR